MLDDYTLNRLKEKTGSSLDNQASVKNLYLVLKLLDEQKREQLARTQVVPDSYHPYLISLGTLLRMVGLKERETKISEVNLNRIAHYLGFNSHKQLLSHAKGEQLGLYKNNGRSGMFLNRTIYSELLSIGTYVKFKYGEDRRITLKYCGDNIFYVCESFNSRMKSGEKYLIPFFTHGQILHTKELSTDRHYSCGENGGIYDLVCGDTKYPNNEVKNNF